VLHRTAYAALGLDAWRYRAVECGTDDLAGTLRGLDAEGLAGVSLTMPLKRAVLPLLARTQRLAADVGAVNTVTFGGIAGEWWGANTDVPAMVTAMRAAGGVRPGPAWVLGAGATAASALAALAELGVDEVVVVARRRRAAADLADVAAGLGMTLDVRPWADLLGCRAASLVVSTTPAGATDSAAEALATSARRDPAASASPASGEVTGTFFDVVYAPWPTPLAAAWENCGGQVIGGLELLVEQAAEQVRLMTGRRAPVDEMRAAGRAALSARAPGGHC
jgi:shikimate dehydrogenase